MDQINLREDIGRIELDGAAKDFVCADCWGRLFVDRDPDDMFGALRFVVTCPIHGPRHPIAVAPTAWLAAELRGGKEERLRVLRTLIGFGHRVSRVPMGGMQLQTRRFTAAGIVRAVVAVFPRAQVRVSELPAPPKRVRVPWWAFWRKPVLLPRTSVVRVEVLLARVDEPPHEAQLVAMRADVTEALEDMRPGGVSMQIEFVRT